MAALKAIHVFKTRWPGWAPTCVKEHQKPFRGGREDVGSFRGGRGDVGWRTDCYKVCFRSPPTHLQLKIDSKFKSGITLKLNVQ